MNAAHATEAALLRAVLEDPADDVPRLVLADAWQERGEDGRAEFVRVQIELERPVACAWAEPDGPCLAFPPRGRSYCCPACTRRERLLWREPELLGEEPGQRLPQPRPEWSGLTALLPWDSGRWQYRRGFVARVECRRADWLAWGPAAVLAAPVEEVALADAAPTHERREGEPDRWRWFFRRARWESGYGVYATWDMPPQWQPFFAPNVAGYPNEAAARGALSAAALAWARQAAGLPALQPKE